MISRACGNPARKISHCPDGATRINCSIHEMISAAVLTRKVRMNLLSSGTTFFTRHLTTWPI